MNRRRKWLAVLVLTPATAIVVGVLASQAPDTEPIQPVPIPAPILLPTPDELVQHESPRSVVPTRPDRCDDSCPGPSSAPVPTPAAVLEVDEDRWPHVADHIQDAQAAGESTTCTLDRPGAEERRAAALASVPTRDAFDRDEYPWAMCAEGGLGADVRHVPSEENRSHGAWLGNTVERWPDGTVLVITVVP